MTIGIPSSFRKLPLSGIDFGVWVAVLLPRLLYWRLTGVAYEDAYISLRYAENLARGVGLVYNPGEWVFGASTPLHVILLAAWARLGLPALPTAQTIGAIADALTATIWCRWLREAFPTPCPAGMFVALGALSPLLVEPAVSGMETPLVMFCFTLAIAAARRRRPASMGFALGLMALARPDALLAAAILLLLVAREWRPWWRSLAVMLLVLAPWLIGATLAYGTPLPHSIVAKDAAYRTHRPMQAWNLVHTLGSIAPIAGTPGQRAVNLLVFPLALVGAGWWWGVWGALGRAVPLTAIAYWAYLVLPGTLLFRWYFPPFLWLVYLLAAGGLGRFLARAWEEWRWLGRWIPIAVTVYALGWCAVAARDARRIALAEQEVRRGIGRLLAVIAPPDAVVATEPIGYVGYYSRRRILDEVGLVSPQMVPLVRAGAGWFAAMVDRFEPEWIVERPGFLLANRTINTGVAMFRTDRQRRDFHRRYEAVVQFASWRLTRRMFTPYHFIVYRRRP